MCRSSTLFLIIASWGSIAGLCGSGTAAASEPLAGDLDRRLQGEYLGRRDRAGATPYLGLQVVAMGDGQFEARLLPGGLPGAGWDRTSAMALAGSRNGDRLQLDAGQTRILIDPQGAVCLESGRVTHLRRIERVGPTLGAAPPPGAIVLFQDAVAQQLERAAVTKAGFLAPGTQTAFAVGDMRIHLEFRTPFMPSARGQSRGNSGVYIQERYEVQILDSFGLRGENNECGALYKQQSPELNMCLPPLQWQTYDIEFRAPRFDPQGNKLSHARVTVLHNGEPIHWEREVIQKTGGGKPEGPEPRRMLLQDHGNPVEFNNVWLVELSPERCPPEASLDTSWGGQPPRLLRRRRRG